MHTTLAATSTARGAQRRALYRTAEAALWVGIAAAIFLTVVWFISPLTDYPMAFQHTGDYLYTGNGVPFGLAPLALVWSLRKLHGEIGGRKASVGVWLASLSLVVLMVICVASVVASHEVRVGPIYVLATLCSIIGIWLCCAAWSRAGLLPRLSLFLWAFSWTVGGELGPKGSQLLLAAAYGILLGHVRNCAREDSNL